MKQQIEGLFLNAQNYTESSIIVHIVIVKIKYFLSYGDFTLGIRRDFLYPYFHSDLIKSGT